MVSEFVPAFLSRRRSRFRQALGWVVACAVGLAAFLWPLAPASAVDQKNRLRAAKTNQRAVALVTHGQVAKARQMFLESTRQDPTFADPYYNLANLAIKDENWDQAVHWLRAYLHRETNEHRAALAVAKEAAVIVEGEKESAKQAMARKDYRGAAHHLQNCLRLEPANNHFRLALAMAQVAALDYPSAKVTLTKLVKPTPADTDKAKGIQQTMKSMQALDQRGESAARAAYRHAPGDPVAASGSRRHGKIPPKPIKLSGNWRGTWKLDAPDRNETLDYGYAVNPDGNNYLEVTLRCTRKPDQDWQMTLPPLSKAEQKGLNTLTATTRFPLRVTQVAVDQLNVDCDPGQLVSWQPGTLSKEVMGAWLRLDARMNVAVPHFQSVTLVAGGGIH